MTNYDESGLEAFFQQYRVACPEPEASAYFMPALWQKIEARRGFWPAFQNYARRGMAGCAALTLMLLALNMITAQHDPSYTDALVAMDYAETVQH